MVLEEGTELTQKAALSSSLVGLTLTSRKGYNLALSLGGAWTLAIPGNLSSCGALIVTSEMTAASWAKLSLYCCKLPSPTQSKQNQITALYSAAVTYRASHPIAPAAPVAYAYLLSPTKACHLGSKLALRLA